MRRFLSTVLVTVMAETKLEGEVAKIVQSVRNEYKASLAKENSLIQELNQQKLEAQGMRHVSAAIRCRAYARPAYIRSEI